MTGTTMLKNITPQNVHETLGRNILADGFGVVLDLDKSHGVRLYDSKSNQSYLDMFSCFASAPLGFNHPQLVDPEFVAHLGRIAVNKPSNSDLYSVEMAEFVDTFARLAAPKDMPHLFFVEGGGLGVENALKSAMDWKVRKNLAAGKGEKGKQVMHFRDAFHGRTGYTLSLTNTDPVKTMYFTQFDWPRIPNPKVTFPLTDAGLKLVKAAEAAAIAAMKQAFHDRPDDICAIILEPIQGEGGDNHFRKEFFQELRRLADENEALLIFDEVQTGLGMTGKMWAHENYGVQPDAFAFGKKTQVCGCVVGRRIEEVSDNVFSTPSRLNSTWGGNLIDMVRCRRYLEIIDQDKLVANAATVGKHLLEGLQGLAARHPDHLSNARGVGLYCAFDTTSGEARGKLLAAAFERGLMAIGSGDRTVRFRPALIVQKSEIDEALQIFDEALQTF
jgi:L-lysine 6-transaminase